MRVTFPVTRQLCMRTRSQAVLLTYPSLMAANRRRCTGGVRSGAVFIRRSITLGGSPRNGDRTRDKAVRHQGEHSQSCRDQQ